MIHIGLKRKKCFSVVIHERVQGQECGKRIVGEGRRTGKRFLKKGEFYRERWERCSCLRYCEGFTDCQSQCTV